MGIKSRRILYSGCELGYIFGGRIYVYSDRWGEGGGGLIYGGRINGVLRYLIGQLYLNILFKILPTVLKKLFKITQTIISLLRLLYTVS